MRNGYEEGKFKEGIVMKANTPEKIYLQEPTKVRTEKKYDNDIEYTHTDAFIEKAAWWLLTNANDYRKAFSNGYNTHRLVEDFVEYMKGE